MSTGEQRQLLELRLELNLYLKFKTGGSFTLRDLFNEVGMANLDEGLAQVILQNILTTKWTMLPKVDDDSNLDDEYRITLDPLLEPGLFSSFDAILKFESSIEGSKILKPYRDQLTEILNEPGYEQKARKFLAFTLEHPDAYNNSIA